MPIPTPNNREQQRDYLERCIGFLVEEGTPQDQAAAICYNVWQEKSEEVELPAWPEEDVGRTDQNKDIITVFSLGFMGDEKPEPYAVEPFG